MNPIISILIFIVQMHSYYNFYGNDIRLDITLGKIEYNACNPPNNSYDSLVNFMQKNIDDYYYNSKSLYIRNIKSNQYIKLDGDVPDSHELGIGFVSTGYLDFLQCTNVFYDICRDTLKTNLGVYLGMSEFDFINKNISFLHKQVKNHDISIYHVMIIEPALVQNIVHCNHPYYAKYVFHNGKLLFFGFGFFNSLPIFENC
jgi:hypothetical protein